MRQKSLPALFAALIFSASSFANISLEVDGIKGELEDNVDAYISSIPESDYSTQLRFQSRLQKVIVEAANALGYYHPNIDFEVRDSGNTLYVHIDPGEVTKLELVDIVITGEAEKDPAFARLIERSGLKAGEPLNHGKYDGLKSSLRNLALQRGYFNGDYITNRLEVAPELNQAFIRMHYDSGIRYKFGATTVTGSQIEDKRVASLQPYKEGDPYLVSKVGEHNQNLSNTEWFSSVLVEPDLSQLDGGRELPIKVSLSPQSRNQIETGIGYSTDVGVRGTLKWKKPWVNDLGHSFDSSFSISEPEQYITAGYKMPLEDVLHDYYRIHYGLKNEDNRDTKSLESNLAVERHWVADSGWHRTMYVRYLIESYQQGILDDIGQFVMPGFTFSRTRTRADGKLITWGDKQTITIEYGTSAFVSETNLIRVLGSTSWIRSAGDNHRGVFRVGGGANWAGDFDKLPPSLRFFAGGDNNLRGYEYESISPLDSSGALAGAKYMVTGTAEYQYRLTGNWWGALFIDGGDAFDSFPTWKTGVGAGIRWVSPVGPIRFDFAWGLDAEPGDQFRIHFSLGPEL